MNASSTYMIPASDPHLAKVQLLSPPMCALWKTLVNSLVCAGSLQTGHLLLAGVLEEATKVQLIGFS